MTPFHPLGRDPHWQTVAGSLWRRRLDLQRFPVESVYIQTEPAVRVLAHKQTPPNPHGTLVMVHGLEGSSDRGYMCSMAEAALEAGYAVYRTNIRGCGGTEGLCNTLYHAGLTSDLLFICRELRRNVSHPIFLAGFSLGGNQCLKLAGELGEEASGLLAGVVAISAPLDLHACAIQITRRENWLYQRSFVTNMAERLRLRHRLMPDVFSIEGVDGIRTVYEFDDRVTAKFFGFGTADRYYELNSSGGFLDRIRVPALLIQAKDDPLVPFSMYSQPALQRNPWLRLLAVEHGGHVGFIAREKQARFWLDSVVPMWMNQTRESSIFQSTNEPEIENSFQREMSRKLDFDSNGG